MRKVIILVVFHNHYLHILLLDLFFSFVVRNIFFFLIAILFYYLVIFTLIAVAVFGGKVFPNSVTVNWAYIIAVFAMVLFLVAGILFILDAVHSQKQIAYYF